MDDEYVRVNAHTSVTDHQGERHAYSFTHTFPSDLGESLLAEAVYRLCVEMAIRMVRQNHLFGCTIGPLRVETMSEEEWQQQLISSSSSSEPRPRPVSAGHPPD